MDVDIASDPISPMERSASLPGILDLVHRAGQSLTLLYGTEAGRAHMTTSQYLVLRAVAAEDGASQTRLVARTGIDRSTLSDIIRRLMRRGWVTRKRSRADGRAYEVTVTPPGTEALRRAEANAAMTEQRIAGIMPRSDAEALVRALQCIIHEARPLREAPGRDVPD